MKCLCSRIKQHQVQRMLRTNSGASISVRKMFYLVFKTVVCSMVLAELL